MDDHVDVYDWLRPGDLIAARYAYLGPIAHGRVGLLLRVADEHGVELALKTIRPKARRASTPARLAATEQSLRDEFAILRAVRHRNLIAAYARVRDPRMGWCTVMEHGAGGTLRAALRARRLTPPEALAVYAQLLDAVAALHRPCAAFPGGIVHLDLAPKNVVFSATGVPKLCDLHYARPLAAGAGVPVLPSDAEGGIDVRTDLRQLGLLLYELLTLETPDALALDLLPAPLAPFVARLTADDPAARYQTIDEARRAYEAARAALPPP